MDKSTDIVYGKDSVEMTCPCCDKKISIDNKQISVEDAKAMLDGGCTLDCKHCDALLQAENGKLYDFHAHLNAQDARWPADGSGTGSVNVGTGEIKMNGEKSDGEKA